MLYDTTEIADAVIRSQCEGTGLVCLMGVNEVPPWTLELVHKDGDTKRIRVSLGSDIGQFAKAFFKALPSHLRLDTIAIGVNPIHEVDVADALYQISHKREEVAVSCANTATDEAVQTQEPAKAPETMKERRRQYQGPLRRRSDHITPVTLREMENW